MTYGPIEEMWARFENKIANELAAGQDEIFKAKLAFYAGVNAGVIAVTEALAENHSEEEKMAILHEIGEELRAFNDSVYLTAMLLDQKIKGTG